MRTNQDKGDVSLSAENAPIDQTPPAMAAQSEDSDLADLAEAVKPYLRNNSRFALRPPSRFERLLARILSFVAMTFTLLWFAGLAMLQKQPYDGPVLLLADMFLTLPIVLICTVIALFLVGPRGCKLAWISLCVYFMPCIVVVLMGIFSSLFGLSGEAGHLP